MFDELHYSSAKSYLELRKYHLDLSLNKILQLIVD
jgi:hypothetical protein